MVSYKTLWVVYVPGQDKVELFCRQESAESAKGHMQDESYRKVQRAAHTWDYYKGDKLVFTLAQQRIHDSGGLPT
jgi:hypothetical protein